MSDIYPCASIMELVARELRGLQDWSVPAISWGEGASQLVGEMFRTARDRDRLAAEVADAVMKIAGPAALAELAKAARYELDMSIARILEVKNG